MFSKSEVVTVCSWQSDGEDRLHSTAMMAIMPLRIFFQKTPFPLFNVGLGCAPFASKRDSPALPENVDVEADL